MTVSIGLEHVEAEMGMMASGAGAGALIAELSHRAPLEGGNTGAWPGLTIYRFTSPTGPTTA